MRLPALPWPTLHAAPLATWLPALDALRARWGLTGDVARLPGGEDCAAFAVGDDLVVKLVPPGSERAVAKEVSLLARVAGRLPVPTPRLLERHDVDGWAALLLTRVPGRLAGHVWPTLAEGEKERVLRALGDVMVALRAVPTRTADPRWTTDGVLLHGDLTDENVLLAERDGRWEIGGVLDFAGSFVGEAGLEIVSPGLFLARGKPRLVAALLGGAALADSTVDDRVRWHLTHPFCQLPRDLAMCGATDVREIWAIAG
jgi:hygromycin-B 7''-O-kinase